MSQPVPSEPGFLCLQAYTLEALEAVAAEFLRDRGHYVEKWRPWETPGQIVRRLGISYPTFRRRMLSPACPKYHAEKDGTGQKFVRVSSTKLLDEFLLSGKDVAEI